MKRLISAAVSLAMAASMLTAVPVTAEGNYTYTKTEDNTLIITGYDGSITDLDIPKEIDGLPVKEIGTSAFEGNTEITSVIIPEGVETIGYKAFYKCSNLKKVVIPSTITEFGYIANTASQSSGYESYAFAECTSLNDLTLTEGMTVIGGHSFAYCTSLESVTIPSTIKDGEYQSENDQGGKVPYWAYYSFYQCTSLKNITLKEGLEVIGASAFRGTAVESVVIPSTIVHWDNAAQYTGAGHGYAFGDCKNLSSVVFKEGIKTITHKAFQNCPLLKRVVIPASVTDISYAFWECPGLEEVIFEDGSQVTAFLNDPFFMCENLKAVEVPEKVTNFDNMCFQGCTSLRSVYMYCTSGAVLGGSSQKFPNVKFYCYSGSDTYFNMGGKGKLEDIEYEIDAALKVVKEAVTAAKEYSEEDYTAESYGVLKALIEKGEKYGNKSHVLAMKLTAEEIYKAIEGLEEKKDEPSSSDPSDSSNPTDDSSDPSNSSGNNNQSQSPNTPATPSTSAPTTATPKPITPLTVTTTVAKPAKVKNVKVTAKKKKLNVSWKKVSGATGYEVMSATNNKFTKNKKTVTVKKNKVTLKKLKPKKKYFVKVRAYKLASGRKYFGKWSKVVKKKTK